MSDLDYLLSPVAVRETTSKIYELTKAGKTNFELHEDKLQEVADFVLEVIRDNYPSLEIPFHSRWGHFQVGDIDRNSKLDTALKGVDKTEVARTKLDLVVTSVLLDAGAGASWKFQEDDKSFSRSEGLGVASWHMFMDKKFSNEEALRADAKTLMSISEDDINQAFQVSDSNPLVGAAGRAGLLKSLGECVSSKPEVFKDARPGNIVDYMKETYGDEFEASDLLGAVLKHFGSIWPSRLQIDGVNLGDIWKHQASGELVAFHKLSQWLTYSLIEPIEEAGLKVKNVNKLTGLAEYRNGGLIVDMGLITLKDIKQYSFSHKPDSDLIIEWRALTVVMLDKIADIVRSTLNFDEQNFPLAKVLEGGTWWAGRRIAATKRADSSPPIKLDSDGTVF